MRGLLVAILASVAFALIASRAQSGPIQPIQTPDHSVYCKSVNTRLTRNVGIGCWRPSSKYRDRQTGRYRYRMWVVFWANTKVERTSISAERRYPKGFWFVVRPKPGRTFGGVFRDKHGGQIVYSVSRRNGEWGIRLESRLEVVPERPHGFYLSRSRIRVW